MDGKLRQMTALYLVEGEKILMLYRIGSRVVEPSWCGIGGHFEPEELNDSRACVLREAGEEIGLKEADVEGLCLRYVTMRYTKGEIRFNHYFFAALKPGVTLPETCPEGKLEWISFDGVMERNMPVTAGHVLEHYLREGKDTDWLYGGVTTENGTVFSVMGKAEK